MAYNIFARRLPRHAAGGYLWLITITARTAKDMPMVSRQPNASLNTMTPSAANIIRVIGGIVWPIATAVLQPQRHDKMRAGWCKRFASSFP